MMILTCVYVLSRLDYTIGVFIDIGSENTARAVVIRLVLVTSALVRFLHRLLTAVYFDRALHSSL